MKNKNLYLTLNIKKNASYEEIKNSYRNLSKKYHPDVSKEDDAETIFKNICDAYKILSNVESRSEYDKISRFGQYYDESLEIYDSDFDFNYDKTKSDLEKFKRDELLDVVIMLESEEDFKGSVEYERWVICTTCEGTGKDTSTQIKIKDSEGRTIVLEGDSGCDFCDGTGKDWRDQECSFCLGKGKVGMNDCLSCSGERRIRGKQKVSGISLKDGEYIMPGGGNFSKTNAGKSGRLIIKVKS